MISLPGRKSENSVEGRISGSPGNAKTTEQGVSDRNKKVSKTEENTDTVMILSFRTDMPGQTVQKSSLIRVYIVCHSVCIVWTHYSIVEPHSSNFRVIRTNFLDVRIFRKFTILPFHRLL